MKNRYKKESKHYIKGVFKDISHSKMYKYFLSMHYVFRVSVWVVFIWYGLFSFFIPILPGSLVAIIFWSLIISGKVNYVQSKFLYFINYFRIKFFFFKIYEKYKVFKILIHKKNSK